MKRSEMVMSPVGVGLECEPAFAVGLAVEFEPEVAPPDGAETGWGAPEDCPEGAEPTAVCAVEPEGAGVNPTVADIEIRGIGQRELQQR
jgi:hypothetical protein